MACRRRGNTMETVTSTCSWTVRVVPMTARPARGDVDHSSAQDLEPGDTATSRARESQTAGVKAMVFQDELACVRRRQADSAVRGSKGGRRHNESRSQQHNDDAGDGRSGGGPHPSTIDEMFFELANSKCVGYRCPSGAVVTVMQVPEVVDCTGGVVWETAYALAGWLTVGPPHARIPTATTPKGNARPTVLELGAGCGLLGAVLARCGCDVLVTEVDQALPFLLSNISANAPSPPAWLRCSRLLWGHDEDIAAVMDMAGPEVSRSGFDAIVATDVIFERSLVEPLLQTMHTCVAAHGVVHVCVQVRCADAHALFLDRASQYFDDVVKLTHEFAEHECVAFATDCDCELFRLGRKRPLP